MRAGSRRRLGLLPVPYKHRSGLQVGSDRQWCVKVVQIASGSGMRAPAPSVLPSPPRRCCRTCGCRCRSVLERSRLLGADTPLYRLSAPIGCHTGADRYVDYRCAPRGLGWCCTRLTLRATPAPSAAQPARNARGHRAFALGTDGSRKNQNHGVSRIAAPHSALMTSAKARRYCSRRGPAGGGGGRRRDTSPVMLIDNATRPVTVCGARMSTA